MVFPLGTGGSGLLQLSKTAAVDNIVSNLGQNLKAVTSAAKTPVPASTPTSTPTSQTSSAPTPTGTGGDSKTAVAALVMALVAMIKQVMAGGQNPLAGALDAAENPTETTS